MSILAGTVVVAPNRGAVTVGMSVLAGAEPINHDGVVDVDIILSPVAVGNEKSVLITTGNVGAFGNRGGRCTGDIVGIGSGVVVS